MNNYFYENFGSLLAKEKEEEEETNPKSQVAIWQGLLLFLVHAVTSAATTTSPSLSQSKRGEILVESFLSLSL